MAVALIVAAGRGERLGAAEPKALVSVCGRPMLEWSVEALRQVPRVTQIVVALPPDRLDAAPAGSLAVAGGETRSQSVLAALRAAAPAGAAARPDGGTDRDDIVIVHDAARVLATADLFNAALDAIEASGADAVVTAAPVTDTIKQTSAGRGRGGDGGRDGGVGAGDPAAARSVRAVTATLDRSTLWAVQTPQVFRRSALESALTADPALLAQATDDAWLIEQAGGTVVVLPTTPENFKITTTLDLRLAELLLSERALT